MMTITTKFNIWDTVWIVKDDKAYSFKVYGIEIYKSKDCCLIIYKSIEGENEIKSSEASVVWSREELINLL